MFEEAIDAISEREWEDAVAAHVAWGETWHGDLLADVFFGVWVSLADKASPLGDPIRFMRKALAT